MSVELVAGFSGEGSISTGSKIPTVTPGTGCPSVSRTVRVKSRLTGGSGVDSATSTTLSGGGVVMGATEGAGAAVAAGPGVGDGTAVVATGAEFVAGAGAVVVTVVGLGVAAISSVKYCV